MTNLIILQRQKSSLHSNNFFKILLKEQRTYLEIMQNNYLYDGDGMKAVKNIFAISKGKFLLRLLTSGLIVPKLMFVIFSWDHFKRR